MDSYVFDSSSLIYLEKVKLLEKINERSNKYIPKKVYEEVIKKGLERDEPEAKDINQLIEKKFFQIKKSELNNKIVNVQLLSEADKEVLSLAKETKSIAIIDEIYVTNIADSIGIESHGSLYIILKLIEKRKISKKDAIKYLDKMIELGFYLSASKYKGILDLVRKM